MGRATRPAAQRARNRKPEPTFNRVALARLNDAQFAYIRWLQNVDSEALHDLRVALRRLRAMLRAYAPWLREPLSGKLRRKLKKLTHATNAARDAEVQIAWLDRQGSRIAARERVGVLWLQERLRRQAARADQEARTKVTRRFATLQARLRRALARDVFHRTSASFVTLTQQLYEDQVKALAAALAEIEAIDDGSAIHAARIAGKRVRYLLEPVAATLPGGKHAIRNLKRFQDDLGALNDCFVRARLLGHAMHRAKRRGLHRAADPRAGLKCLAQSVARDRQQRFGRVARLYLGKRTAPFIASLARLGRYNR